MTTRPARPGPLARVRRGFNSMWVPRLGREAAGRLGRMALLALVLGPVVIVLSVIGGLGISSGRSGAVLIGVAAVAAVVTLCLGWIRLSVDFAASVSRHFGQEIRWRELPRFNPVLFDQWVDRRGLRPVAEI